MMTRNSKIINGRAYTAGDTQLYTDLPIEKQEALINWIRKNIHACKNTNYKYSSYALKECAETFIHYYISNNQFKDAMLFCGFYPVNPMGLNWYYKMAKVATR